MYKAEIFKMIDLEESKLNHVSISGGKATHSFFHVGTIKECDLENLLTLVRENYGTAYDCFEEENRYFFGIPEKLWAEKECPENFEAYISKTEIVEIAEIERDVINTFLKGA